MLMRELISIIIPVYNSEKYISKCLDSILNQSYSNLEIICINDGSSDNSLEILESYKNKDSRIKVFSHNNSGTGKTRNVGLENSTGEYIMFCDADDYYEPNMCEMMLKTLLENDVDIVMCRCNIINSIGDRGEDLNYYNTMISGYAKINNDFIFSINYVLWNKIFKKSIIDNFNIKLIEGYEHDDFNFCMKYIMFSSNYYGLDKKLYNYQIINSNSIMSNFYSKKFKERKLDMIYSYNDMLQFALNNNIREEMKNSLISYYVNTFLYMGPKFDKKIIISIINKQKEFFSNISAFDDNWYVKNIKNRSVRKCLRMFKEKSIIDYLFSITEDERYKYILILGIKITIKRI